MTPRRRLLAVIAPLLALSTAAALSARAFLLRRPLTPTSSVSQPTPARPVSTMAGMLPPGALLTIESPDFAALLHTWSSSPESAAWLKSANYSVFTNSRLFGRLSAAQDEFASTAKLSEAGTSLLAQVAGGESIFAWYDIGELQFLYITRMPAGRADRSSLFAQRASFQRRQVGSSVFYVRSELVSGTTRRRTVAFASVGDLLLLSTREDLMAGALNLIGAPGPGPGSLAAEPWYTEASTAQPAGTARPDLHMVLDLERIVPTPYFRTYWIQQNITKLKSYRSAVSDLYRDQTPAGTRFREERTLLQESPSASLPVPQPDPDLGSLASLVPPGSGVYRAEATDDAHHAVSLLNEKLLTRATDTATRAPEALDPDLTPSLAGDASDLETRIDTPAPVAASASTQPLIELLDSSGLQATLTLDTGGSSPGLWLPLHAAVVLRTARPLAPAAFQQALQAALRGTLTASTLGIEFRPTRENAAIFALSGPKPLFLAQTASPAGALIFFSDDLPMLTALLTHTSSPASPVPATLLAGFDHRTQRAPYARLTALIDGPATTSPAITAADQTSSPTPAPNTSAQPPAFFSSNIRSLSDTFARLQSEQVIVRHQGANVHQTVTYHWQP